MFDEHLIGQLRWQLKPYDLPTTLAPHIPYLFPLPPAYQRAAHTALGAPQYTRAAPPPPAGAPQLFQC